MTVNQRVLSRHLTSEGEVRYVACPCGAVHILLNGRPVTAAAGGSGLACGC